MNANNEGRRSSNGTGVLVADDGPSVVFSDLLSDDITRGYMQRPRCRYEQLKLTSWR